MRITYILESLSIIGGVERITMDKINYLSKIEGYDVSLIEVYDFQRPSCYRLPDNVNVVNLGIRKKRSLLLKPFTFRKVCCMVKKAVVEINSDIVICSALLGNILFSTTKLPCKTIYESHGPRHKMLLKFLLPYMERRVSAVITLTEGDKNEYKIAKRVDVIPNFSTKEVLYPSNLSSYRCLFVGRLSWEKNIPRLLSVWKNVIKNRDDWKLNIVGDGPLEDDIKKIINSMDLTYSVEMHHSTNDIMNVYSNSSILLMTSEYEGFGLVLIEAMKCGLPVVAFDCPYGPRSIITDGVDGYLIPYNDDNAMVKKVHSLMEDVALRRRMGAKGIENSSKYNIDCVMEQWMQLFSEL